MIKYGLLVDLKKIGLTKRIAKIRKSKINFFTKSIIAVLYIDYKYFKF